MYVALWITVPTLHLLSYLQHEVLSFMFNLMEFIFAYIKCCV